MRIRAVDAVDVFVYLVVLALFTQFLPDIITESFAVALLTAVLFKLALEVIAFLKTRILDRVRAAPTTARKVLNSACLCRLLAGRSAPDHSGPMSEANSPWRRPRSRPRT